MELDHKSDSGDLDTDGYDIVSQYAVRGQDKETGQDLLLGCHKVGDDELSDFDQVRQTHVPGSDAFSVYQEGNVKSDDSSLLTSEENVCAVGREGVSLAVLQAAQMEVVELNQNSDSRHLNPGNDFVNSSAVADQEDPIYVNKEETGKGLPLGFQRMGDNELSEFDQVTQVLMQDRNAAAVYQEGGVKSDDTTLLTSDEDACIVEREDVSLIAWLEFLKHVSNQEAQMNMMEFDQNSSGCGNLDLGYDFVSSYTIPDQEDTLFFPEAETGIGLPFGCKWMGSSLSEFDPVTQILEPDSDTAPVFQECGIKSNDSTLSIPEENICASESEDVSVVAWEEFLKPVSNPEEKMEQNVQEKMEENGQKKMEENVLEKMEENVQEKMEENVQKKMEENVQEKMEENVQKKMEENVQEKMEENVQENMQEKKEENIQEKMEENVQQKMEENVQQKMEENMQEKKEVDILEKMEENVQEKMEENVQEKMEENVKVDEFLNTNAKVVEDMRKGFKLWKSYVYEKTENFRIPTYYNLRALPDAISDQTLENNESLEPNFVGTDDEEQRDATPASDSFFIVAESDGKDGPGVGHEEISNTSDEPKKEKVSLEELNLRTVENTAAVLDGQDVGRKSLGIMDRTCTEKVNYRGEWKKAEKAGEDGAGEPASKGTPSKKKQKKKKAQKQKPVTLLKKSPNSTDTMSVCSTPLNSNTSENSYAKGVLPGIESSFVKKVSPGNEKFDAKGFAKGIRPASEGSYPKGFSPMSEQSHAKGISPTSEHSYGRGFKPNTEHMFFKGGHQDCEVLYTKGLRPTRENLRVIDFHRMPGYWFAKNDQPLSFNLSRERKVSFSDILIAKRENKASYLNTLRDTKHISLPHCSSPTPILMSRLGRSGLQKPCDHFGASGPVPSALPAGTRKVAVIKPRPKEEEVSPKQILIQQTERDFVDTLLATDNMFESRSTERRKGPGHEKQANGILDEPGINFQRSMTKELQRKGQERAQYTSDRAQYSSDRSAERGARAGRRQWPPSPAGRHPDYNRGSFGMEVSHEMESPKLLKYVNWVGKEDIGHFFVSGLTNLNTARKEESGCHSQPDFMTFDELVLLDGLETAVVSIADSIKTVVAKGFVARFPGSCILHLLINEDDKVYPESIIVCCSCPELIIANQVGAVKSCPQCRFVRLGTYPDQKIKCQFMLLRSAHMLRFVLLSSSLSICDWETRLLFGWFHDFPVIQETNSNCCASSDQQSAPFWNDLTEFLASMDISDLSVFSGVDFSKVSPALRLIHTKPVVSCVNDLSKYGASQLQKIIGSLVWKSPKKRQSLYKTERLGLHCNSILNDVFPKASSDDSNAAVKFLKVVYPSFRWVNECLANSGLPERLELLPTIKDINSVGDLPWNFLHDLCGNKDFVQNYNVLMQYENWEHPGKSRKYGWFLTGSQSLDTESWGDDYPVYHKVMYKHFQLSVGFFPYLCKNEHLKVEVCAVDLCDIPLPFDSVALDCYRRDDMPRLVLRSGHNVLCHCVGVFTRAKLNSGFVRESPLLHGLLEPFPVPQLGQIPNDVFLHVSSLSQLELPPEGSVIEFFFLNRPPTQSNDFIKVCGIFSSIEEARLHFLSAMPGLVVDDEMVHKDMVKAKALAFGIEWIDNVKQMEDAIEDFYNNSFSTRQRRFTYFPTQQQVDAISIEPVKILSDAEWVQDYYKNRRNRGGLSQDVGGCRPKALLANFQAMKYRFAKDLHETEELNQKLEEENRRSIQKCSN